jgi:hypothetical protein
MDANVWNREINPVKVDVNGHRQSQPFNTIALMPNAASCS